MAKLRNFNSSLLKWLDEFKLSFVGLSKAFLKRRFRITFIVSFFFFGILLNLLAGGSSSFKFLGTSGFVGFLNLVFKAFLAIFGVGRSFLDWLFIFLISLLQASLIGLVSVVYKYRKDSADLQNIGIISGLAILSSGCPTCGTTLLTPVIISIVGSSGMAVAGTISWILTILSIIIALFALKKIGFEAYSIFMEERYRKKHATKGENE